MISKIQNKKVLFITTKNLDYLRNTQEINLIKEHAQSYNIIGSFSKSYTVRLASVYWKLFTLSLKDYDIVFVGFAPQLVVPFFGYKFRKKFLIEDFFISFYDTLCFDRKKFRPESIIGKLLRSLDKKTIKSANMVICDTNTHGAYFTKEFGVDSLLMNTLYLEADTDIYYPVSNTKPETLRDKFVVLYFGSILPLQGVDIVLEAYDILKNEKEIFMYCIGPIKDQELSAKKPISDNIQYIDWLSQKDLATHIGYADLCLAGHFNANIEKAKRTIPGKTYIYQAMNKPMILGENPANHELFSTNEKISFVEMGNAQALADEIIRLSKKTVP